MITCERCKLTILGGGEHLNADDCLRYILPRFAAMGEMLTRQAEHQTRIEGRLERDRIQTKTAEQGRRDAARELKHERDKAARLAVARNTLYSAVLSANAQAVAEKKRFTKAVTRARKVLDDYLVGAA